MAETKKIYCYVDETGQDAAAEYFIVVTVITENDQALIRQRVLELEKLAKVGARKWHKSRAYNRENFLNEIIERRIAAGDVYYGKYEKPLPFFLPVLETLSKAIEDKVQGNYRGIVYIDGIDKKKSQELTNALRLKGMKIDHVRPARDESEPMIRLADRWAGCLRESFSDKLACQKIVEKAKQKGILREIKPG